MPEDAKPAAAPSPARFLPLVLAFCVGLGASGVVLGLAAVLAWDEPLRVPPLLKFPPPEEGYEEAYRAWDEVLEEAPKVQLQVLQRHRAELTALAAIDLISSLVLFLGSLAARRRNLTGLRLLRTGLVLSQGYAVLKLGVQTWAQLDLYRSMRPLFDPLVAGGGAAEGMAVTAIVAQLAAVVVTVALALGELGFYVWSHRYLRRPAVVEILAGS